MTSSIKVNMSSEEKYNVAKMVLNKQLKGKDAAEHFGISHNTLRYYVSRVKKDTEILDRVGRHKIIDSYRDRNLKLQLQEISENDATSIDQLIRQAARATYEARNPNLFKILRKNHSFISQRSLNRYYDYYHQFMAMAEI